MILCIKQLLFIEYVVCTFFTVLRKNKKFKFNHDKWLGDLISKKYSPNEHLQVANHKEVLPISNKCSTKHTLVTSIMPKNHKKIFEYRIFVAQIYCVNIYNYIF